MRISNRLVAIVCSCIAIGPAIVSAVEFDDQKLAAIHQKMEAYVDAKVIPGAVTAVGSADGIAKLDSVGVLTIEKAEPLPTNALYRIASMTKPITAIGVMILVDEGRLAVTDPVEKYLPEFKGQKLIVGKNGDKTELADPPRSITVRDLLTHTSGLPGGFPAPHADLYFKRNLTLAEAVKLSASQPLEFAPGTRWAYCNAGIDTLGRIIEVISGKSYEDFLQERIFSPLGMRDTTFYPTPEQLQRLAGLYDQEDGRLQFVGYSLLGPSAEARHPIPAGGLYSTASDQGRLYQMMLQRGTLDGHRILSDKAVAEMTRVQTGDLPCGFTEGMGFGYGWAVVRQPQGVHAMLSAGTFGHGGAFGTQGWVDPHQGVFVVLMIQRTGLPNADASELRRDLQQVAVDAIRK